MQLTLALSLGLKATGEWHEDIVRRPIGRVKMMAIALLGRSNGGAGAPKRINQAHYESLASR